MAFTWKSLGKLSKKGKLFDKTYGNYKAPTKAPVSEVLEAHKLIIDSYEAFLTELDESKKEEKAAIYNDMHVQYEGLRKYYGICFDAPEATTAEKIELLDKQYACNAQCIRYAILSRNTYISTKDQVYEEEFREEYEGVKQLLNNAKHSLRASAQISSSSSSSSSSGANLRIDTSLDEVDSDDDALPRLVRDVSKPTETGIHDLMRLRRDSSSDNNSEPASEEDHTECVSTLLTLATPRAALAQQSIHLLNQCWRDVHRLAQSVVFEGHPQQMNLNAAGLLLTSVKTALEDEAPQPNQAFLLSTQGLMAQPNIIGEKRPRSEEEQDVCHTQNSSSSSSFNPNA